MIPHALARVPHWQALRRHAGRLLVALDFDGTLAPIALDPTTVALPPAAREAMLRLCRRQDTDLAVVSGRALEDLRERIALPSIYYAGNHGLEIEGPGIQEVHREATLIRPQLAACTTRLRAVLANEPGVFLEDKGLTLSVHYRRATSPDVEVRLRALLEQVIGEAPALRLTEGKKVFEVRPNVPWDKGRALRFLLGTLEDGGALPIPALFVGDDRTDEDAFRALHGRGDGIVVAAEPPPASAASAYLRSPDEVAALLEALAAPD
jgi:trehalose 6-phosphate phosphatase